MLSFQLLGIIESGTQDQKSSNIRAQNPLARVAGQLSGADTVVIHPKA